MKFLHASALCITLGLLIVPATFARDAYEEPPVRKAEEILPPHLIHGEHFTVQDDVSWIEGLHVFVVETEFGSFDVLGEPMLRVRLAEVDAWVQLENMSATSVGAKAVGRSATRTVTSLAKAFAHPVQTVTGVPRGIGRLFRKAEHTAGQVGSAVDSDDDSDSEGDDDSEVSGSAISNLGNKLIGVNRSYRRLAREVGVNPYTTNEAIQEELLRLAKIDAYAGRTTGILVPGLGLAASVAARVTREIYEESWLEIVARNEEALLEMGASPEQVRELFENDAINLTLQTLMIEVLSEMSAVEGRVAVVDQMIALENDSQAVFFAECLMMADWFHEQEVPLAKMLAETGVPVALATDGRVLSFSASDYAYWTENTEAIVVQYNEQFGSLSDRRELLIADQVSPGFVKGVESHGWTVRSGLRNTVLPEIPWGLSDDPPEESAP